MEALPKHPDVAEQFAALLRELGISGNQLAIALGTSQQAISNYTSGRNKPGREILASISKKYPAINLSWLLTGEGEPFPKGRYNEKPTPTTSPVPTDPEPKPVGLTSGAATVEEATTLIRLAESEATNRQLQKRIEEKDAEISWLRGKSLPSSDAAGLPDYPRPAPITGFRLGVSNRVRERRQQEPLD
ncbi:MAG: helix-turn-helix domain-containing protein [Janthinobacterium lividum]